MERDGWFLEYSRREERSREEGNTNCHGSDAKSTNGKKRKKEWILEEIEKKRERIPRCFSRGETLRRGYCYKMSVWTDFR